MRLLFSTISAARANSRIFRGLQGLHVLAAVLVVLSGSWGPLGVSAFIFIATSAAINNWPAYRRSPFALIVSVGTCLYFVLPMAFITVLGQAYEWGAGLESVPREQADYLAAAPVAFLVLTPLLFVAVAGLALTAASRPPIVPRLTPPLHRAMPIVLLGALVLLLTQQGSAAFIRTRLSGAETAESLWVFIFFDHAYLMLLPLVIFRRLAATRRWRTSARWQFAIVLALFVLQATVGSTSKGFILTAAILCFVIPISLLQGSRATLCLMPSRAAIWAGVFAALWVFVLAEAWRVVVFTGQTGGLQDIIAVLRSQITDFSLTRMVASIAYRLSAGLDRYVLIFDTHFFDYSAAYGAQFASYVWHGFLNLVLPGTPYPEAYVPSSNLLPFVLTRAPLIGEATKAQLIVSLNTQPYTIYGAAIVLLGPAAPLLLIVVTSALGLAYRVSHHIAVRLSLIYLCFAGIHVYGLEAVAANAIHAAVSLFIFIWLMRGYIFVRSWFRVAPAGHTPVVITPGREDTWRTSTH